MVFARERSRIDVVILDVIMAGMGGKRCLDELLKLDPNAKVLMTTGRMEGELVEELIQLGSKEVLKKPFHAQEMVRAVRKIIDRKMICPEIASCEKGSGLKLVSSR